MSEGNRFVVEVVGRLQEAREVTVSRVCDALALNEPRAAALVARMPGVITRPASEDRAMKIALRLQEAGVPALHRPLAEHEDPFRSAERPAPAAPVARGPEAAPPEREAPEAAAPPPEDESALSPHDIPSLDATHHDVEPDPKVTDFTAAGFGAADIRLPVDDERATGERSRPRATFVEAGSTSMPTPHVEDPAITMVRAPSASPTPAPPSDGEDLPERPLTPVSPVLAVGPAAQTAKAAPAPAAKTAPSYRQTRSAAEPPLTLSSPPEEVLKRSGVPEVELPLAGARLRGRFGRHLAAQVALPGLLTWSLTAVALWWFLGEERLELFVTLAAASAVAALIGSLIAAIGTMGVARDVVRLRDEARRVAMGELTAPVGSNRDDELGEIAGSLERVRLSLQEGLERLRQRRR